MQFESRSYLDIDLEDVSKGLWATVGLRVLNYQLSTTVSGAMAGSATYLLPYVEVSICSTNFVCRLRGVWAKTTACFPTLTAWASTARSFWAPWAFPRRTIFYHSFGAAQQNDYNVNLEVGVKL
jgi:hypothetical protein